uniref:TraX family protein n=1 Tax=Candidatus Enterococcus willemsii TaxID=1857215 RepID=UPI00403F7231
MKLFMMALMVLDHISLFISTETAAIFHMLTRCVGVFFAYMSIEGLRYTRNQEKYLGRLWIAGVLMQGANLLLNQFIFAKEYAVHNNIFLTLAVGTTVLYFIQYMIQATSWQKRTLYTVAMIVMLLIGVFTEGGMVLLPFMIICYLCREKFILRNILLVVFALGLFFTSYVDYGNCHTTWVMLGMNSDFLFITILPILGLYNGKPGNNHPSMKSLFYVFYPLHLYLIALLATLS